MSDPTHQDQLSAYLDGELEGGDLSQLEAELRVNPKLRAELDELREVASFVRSNGRVVAPRGFHDRVMARVDAEAPAKPWWAWLRRPFGVPIEGFAVALAAAAVLLLALPKDPSPLALDDEAATEAPKAAAKSDAARSQEEAPEEQAQRQDLADAGDGAPPDQADPATTSTEDPSLQIVRGEATQAEAVATNTATEPVMGNTATLDLEDAVAEMDNTAIEGLGGLIGGAGTTEGELGGLGSVSGGAAGGAGSGYGTAIGATKGAPAPAVAPLPGGAEPFKYKVYADDWSVLAGLQRAAARYQGTLRHTDGSVVQGGQQTSQVATYVVRIPSASLQSFHRDVEKLGVNVVQEAKGSDFADTWIEVSVTVVLLGPARSDAKVDAYQDAME